jgi:isopenicillin N synthase-like dioxygenase
MPATEIPIVDIARSRRGERASDDAIAGRIAGIAEEIGFLVVVGHEVESALVDDLTQAALAFFHQPLEYKMRYASGSASVYRGYTPSAVTALAASNGVATPPDLCELFTINRFDDPEARSRATRRTGFESFFAPNLWPGLPGFHSAFEAYYAEMERLALDLMGLFARALDLPPGFFDAFFDDHITNLTVNFYPQQPAPPLPGQLRRGAHTDWGSLTILHQDGAPGGLEVQTRDGRWLAVPAIAGSYIINLGDLMAFWTNDRWVSNLHRVVNPARSDAGTERLSIPFFHQPSFDAVISPVPTCADPGAAPRSTTSGDWILDKLQRSYAG